MGRLIKWTIIQTMKWLLCRLFNGAQNTQGFLSGYECGTSSNGSEICAMESTWNRNMAGKNVWFHWEEQYWSIVTCLITMFCLTTGHMYDSGPTISYGAQNFLLPCDLVVTAQCIYSCVSGGACAHLPMLPDISEHCTDNDAQCVIPTIIPDCVTGLRVYYTRHFIVILQCSFLFINKKFAVNSMASPARSLIHLCLPRLLIASFSLGLDFIFLCTVKRSIGL